MRRHTAQPSLSPWVASSSARRSASAAAVSPARRMSRVAARQMSLSSIMMADRMGYASFESFFDDFGKADPGPAQLKPYGRHGLGEISPVELGHRPRRQVAIHDVDRHPVGLVGPVDDRSGLDG